MALLEIFGEHCPSGAVREISAADYALHQIHHRPLASQTPISIVSTKSFLPVLVGTAVHFRKGSVAIVILLHCCLAQQCVFTKMLLVFTLVR
jgi:hypothetical protein